MEEKNNCIIRNTVDTCHIFLNTNIYELIKQNIEDLKLFEYEDIALAFLNMDLLNKTDNLQINRISKLGEQEFKVRYVRNMYKKTVKYYIFFTKEIEVKEWDEIYYRVFYNKR